MKKFIITSEKFAGEVAAIYGAEGELQVIDFTGARLMGEKWRHWLKAALPPAYTTEAMHAAFEKAPLVVTAVGYKITFEMFWEVYDKKVNKIRAERSWGRLSVADQALAYNGHAAYMAYLKKNTWQTKADPDTYLKNKYWENQWK